MSALPMFKIPILPGFFVVPLGTCVFSPPVLCHFACVGYTWGPDSGSRCGLWFQGRISSPKSLLFGAGAPLTSIAGARQPKYVFKVLCVYPEGPWSRLRVSGPSRWSLAYSSIALAPPPPPTPVLGP